MAETNYIFCVTAYDTKSLMPQVSRALEKQTELRSRKQYPGLWRGIDRINAVPKRDHQRGPLWKALYVLCLVGGIFLFIPGLMKPRELTAPLVVGALAILCGVWRLWGSRKRKGAKRSDKRYASAAGQLLAGKEAVPEEEKLTVTFSGEGMSIASRSHAAEPVPYSGFACAVETSDALLLVYGELVTLLQKRDLAEGSMDGLRALLAEHIEAFETID